MSIIHGTSRVTISWWARAGAIGFVAVAAVGVADRIVAPVAAQTEPAAAEAVSATPEGGPVGVAEPPNLPVNSSPAISDDGTIVAFVSGADPADQVVVRDRAANTTLFVAEPASSHPAVSADGCVVAYLVEVAADPADTSSTPSVELRVVDRCPSAPDSLPASVLVDTFDMPAAAAAPALSADGSVVVWSTGTAIVRYVRFVSAEGVVVYLADGSFDPLADGAGILPPGAVTGVGVDVSADASVVAFVAGPGIAPYAPSPPDVYVWSDDPADGAPAVVELASMPASPDPAAATAPPEAGSTRPVLSGDGAILLYQSSDTDLAANAVNPAVVVPFVVMYARGFGSAVLDDDARRPAISADGHHAVYDHAGVVQAARWSDGIPFATVTKEVVFGTPDDDPASTWESVSGPLVTLHGRSVVLDSVRGFDLTGDAAFHTGTHVWLQPLAEVAEGPAVDLGTVDVPGTLSGIATFTNTGSAGIPIVAVEVDSPFVLVATTCAGVLQPGASCTVDVSVDLTTDGPADGFVRLTGGRPTTEFVVALTATGTIPPTTTSSTTTTTSTTTTIRPTPTTRPPVITRPPVTTPRTTTTTTTTTTTIPAPVIFNPTVFDFAPTIVNAGRRTAVVDLFNPAQLVRTVQAVRAEPADGTGFSVDGSACISQQLATGGTCQVSIDFTPTVEGILAATVIAEFSDGTSASLAVTGFGAPPPTLTVTPDVAANGQVVTVEGAGFPAGSSVEFSWDDGRVVRMPVIDEIGGFVETMVVLPHTIPGRTELVVFGQVDQFADVAAEVLVTRSGSRSGVTVFGGLGPSVVR